MEKTILRIRLFGDSVLTKGSRPVLEITEYHRNILRQMSRLMYENSGIGLAAPQVGISEQMIVVDIGTGLYKLINPKIVKRSGWQIQEEGCLSIPGICIRIRRANRIKVLAKDEYGKDIAVDAQGLLACVFQHEIDHLRGRLILDYANFFQRLKIRKKLKEVKQMQEKLKDERVS